MCSLVQICETLKVCLSTCSCWLFSPSHKNLQGSTDCQNLNLTKTVCQDDWKTGDCAQRGKWLCMFVN